MSDIKLKLHKIGDTPCTDNSMTINELVNTIYENSIDRQDVHRIALRKIVDHINSRLKNLKNDDSTKDYKYHEKALEIAKRLKPILKKCEKVNGKITYLSAKRSPLKILEKIIIPALEKAKFNKKGEFDEQLEKAFKDLSS